MQKSEASKRQVTISYVDQKILVETVYDREKNKTMLLVSDKNRIKAVSSLKISGKTLVPYSASHAFVKDQVILFAQKAQEYGKVDDLIESIRKYIHKYVDLSEEFETIATHYVLLSWLYDIHNVLGYLRIRGDFGTGKTRFLTIIGSICYKPIFASGAATVAPLFHVLNDIGGTLIMDESDFYHSNEKSLIAKILNNGNAKGFPVLRCEKAKNHTFTTRSFTVYGPKILACRASFDDEALESRFLTENAGVRPLRGDVPLHLNNEQAKEALILRNKLLTFRFAYFRRNISVNADKPQTLSPRMQQVITPLLRFMSPDEQKQTTKWAQKQERQALRDRGMELAAHILIVLQILLKSKSSVEIGQIRNRIMEDFGDHYEHALTAKAIGCVVRNSLQLDTKRLHGRYVVDVSQKEKITLLAKRYGVNNVT